MAKLFTASFIVASALFGAAATLMIGIPVLAAPPLPHATRVIDVEPDNSTGAAGMIGGVQQPWLSDHEVLHFRHGSLYRYDVRATTDTPLASLTRQVKSSHCFLYFLDVSPDGQQVIWGMSANNPLFVATVDGERREQWPSDGGMTQPFWCADGKHWLQFHFGGSPENLRWTSIQIHSLASPHDSETFPSPPPGLNGLDILAAPSADKVIARTPDPVKYGAAKPTKVQRHTDGGTTFTFVETRAFRTVQTISVWSLHQPQPLHQSSVALPGKAMEVVVSPDGRRVAWLLRNKASQSLWVSGLDGGGMHRVGVVRARGGTLDSRSGNFVSQLQWVPGDRAVSFVYAGALWSVPADRRAAATGGSTRQGNELR